MATDIKMTGVGPIRLQYKRRGSAARSWRATVGYSAPYALFVHENLECNHPNGGQAKFIEQPLRAKRAEMGAIVRKVMRRKDGTLKEAVLQSAQFLLAESQKLVPVDTGFLKASGYATVVNYGTDLWGY